MQWLSINIFLFRAMSTKQKISRLKKTFGYKYETSLSQGQTDQEVDRGMDVRISDSELIEVCYKFPGGTPCWTVLKEMKNYCIHIVVVVGEDERTVGLVTLKDIVEKIKGDFRTSTQEENHSFNSEKEIQESRDSIIMQGNEFVTGCQQYNKNATITGDDSNWDIVESLCNSSEERDSNSSTITLNDNHKIMNYYFDHLQDVNYSDEQSEKKNEKKTECSLDCPSKTKYGYGNDFEVYDKPLLDKLRANNNIINTTYLKDGKKKRIKKKFKY
mmetsp:Transcript_22302/g.51092  ORF Transcript_22302/g.51092 Transcript_22302/m.51092 type:complete len:272 (+) Transcript_22302:573-1388(+)